MTIKKDHELLEAFEKASANSTREPYNLSLYIAGSATASLMAVRNIKHFCQENLEGNYTLEVVDIYQQPELAVREQIIATPTLIKHSPSPSCRIVGDLSDGHRLTVNLDFHHRLNHDRIKKKKSSKPKRP